MARLTRKRIILIVVGVLVIAAVIYGFLPDPVPVETAIVARGNLQVIVEEEGETQVENSYAISSPVPAFVRRIDLKPGDPIQAGDVVAQLEPPRAPILDARSRSEARSRIEAAEAALAQAEDQQRAAAAVAQQAVEERERVERLLAVESATPQRVEQATAEARQASANLDAAQKAVARARAEVAAARTALLGSSGNTNLAVQEVLRAPADGRVLVVHRESEGQVAAGEPLIEIGNTGNLEVRVDVLSQDAVRIEPGTRVLIDQWGGGFSLEAVVDRVEPKGFTDISSLGVEEKRVGVIAEPADSAGWDGLGAGFRVLARFIIWEGENVLTVPTSALFRIDDGWATFVVEGGRAVLRAVEIGHQSGLDAEVVEGIAEGEQVIVHPSNAISEGTRVEPR